MSRKWSRRQALAGLGGIGALAAAQFAAACSSPATAPKPAANAEPPKPAVPTTSAAAVKAPAPAAKQIVRFTMFGHPNMIEEMVPAFNAATPEVEVRFDRSEGQGYYEKIPAALAAGDAWDSFRLGTVHALRFGSKGAIADIGPMLQADATYPRSQFLDGIFDMNTVDGKTYGMPGWTNCFWLYYNKRLFDEAGVAYPNTTTTWAEYVEMTKKLTKRSGSTITQYGAAGWGASAARVAVDVWNAGGCFYYGEDRASLCANNGIAAEVLQSEADLMNVHFTHPSPLNPPSSPATIMSKNVATEMNGDWYPWDQKDQWSSDFDATFIPSRGPTRTHLYVSDALVINSKSKVSDAAYKWISWFSAAPESWAIQGKVVFPTTKRMYEDPKLRSMWLAPPRPPTMIELALEHVKHSRLWRVGVHAAQFESTIWNPEVDRLWRNKATAAEVLETVQKKGEELLRKPID